MNLSLDYSVFAERLVMKTEKGKKYVMGHIRKKWLVLTPEEFIRQIVVLYLIEEMAYNKNRIAVEKMLKINGMIRRYDILVFDFDMEPLLMIECKSYKIPLSQAVFDQVANYNISMQIPNLMVTNGDATYCCSIDLESKSYAFLEALPAMKKCL